jgi:hypothetical protein
MAERTTAKEVKIDLDGFKASMERQFSLMFRWIAGLYVLFGGVVATGLLVQVEVARNGVEITGLRRDFTVLQRDIASVQRDVTAVHERFAGLAKGVSGLESGVARIAGLQEQMLADQRNVSTNMSAALSRIDRRLPEINPLGLLALDANERQTIRSYFGVPKEKSSGLKVSLGEQVSGPVDLVPDELVAKVPKLKGIRYNRDPATGSILFVGYDDRIIGIVEPG